MEKRKEVNPNKEPLTVPILKRLMKREDMSDEEAQEIIFSIEALVGIIMDYQEDQEFKANNKPDLDDNLKIAA